MDAEDWLMDTERKLNTVGCNDQEKVRYATHLLCGPAASWWDNIVAIYPAGKVFTWEEFARKFRESNVPESIVELKHREFESLEQKDKAILTYVREFSKLSRYAVDEVNTEDKKKKRFLRGLSPQFKVQLRMMRATEFQELVDAAITLEDDFKQLQEEKRKKAKFEPKRFYSNKPNTSLSFKPRYNNNNNNNNNNYYEILVRKYSRNWTKSKPRGLFSHEASRSPKERRRGATEGPHHRAARPPLAARPVVWGPVPPLDLPFRL
ncbi:hypothetical protein QYE76_035461 [Lolium multiflorum]|uniref:Retrotransposon gag domain-containing protein n=1 Tax=Lolium multiflorum TaxID=4521 RepID=A0AAD8R2Y9_LOLMU|nr:hypothetical protein QYE76_035461 [Lolium multiflorum]